MNEVVGRRGRRFRRAVAGIPTGKLRDRFAQMTANADLAVVVVDAAYTSRWGAQHWMAPLRQHHPETTGHHAAALVIGRREQCRLAGGRLPDRKGRRRRPASAGGRVPGAPGPPARRGHAPQPRRG